MSLSFVFFVFLFSVFSQADKKGSACAGLDIRLLLPSEPSIPATKMGTDHFAARRSVGSIYPFFIFLLIFLFLFFLSFFFVEKTKT